MMSVCSNRYLVMAVYAWPVVRFRGLDYGAGHEPDPDRARGRA